MPDQQPVREPTEEQRVAEAIDDHARLRPEHLGYGHCPCDGAVSIREALGWADQQPVREPTEAQRLDDLYGLLNSAWMNAEGPERVAFQRAKLSVRVLRQMWDELERQLQEAREQPLCVHCGESPDADNVCADVGLHFRCTDEHHQPGSISLCPHQPVVAHERLRRALEEWAGEKHSETHWMNDWPSYERSCSYCRALTAEAGQQEDK